MKPSGVVGCSYLPEIFYLISEPKAGPAAHFEPDAHQLNLISETQNEIDYVIYVDTIREILREPVLPPNEIELLNPSLDTGEDIMFPQGNPRTGL